MFIPMFLCRYVVQWIYTYCHIQLTIATSRTIISPLIKTANKFTILSGNIAVWVN